MNRCWVCEGAIALGEASCVPERIPYRLRRYQGRALHVRCHGEWNGVRIPSPPRRPRSREADVLPSYAQLLFADDLAQLRGITSRHAARWLESLERTYGKTVVGRLPARNGVRRYTTNEALATIGPRHLPNADVDSLRALQAQMQNLECKIDMLAEALREKMDLRLSFGDDIDRQQPTEAVQATTDG